MGARYYIGGHKDIVGYIENDASLRSFLKSKGKNDNDIKKIIKEDIHEGVCLGLSAYWLKHMQESNGDVEKASKKMREELKNPSAITINFLVNFLIDLLKRVFSTQTLKEPLDERSPFLEVAKLQNVGEFSSTVDGPGTLFMEQDSTMLNTLAIQGTQGFISPRSKSPYHKDLIIRALNLIPSNTPTTLDALLVHSTAIYRKESKFIYYDSNLGFATEMTAAEVAEEFMNRYSADSAENPYLRVNVMGSLSNKIFTGLQARVIYNKEPLLGSDPNDANNYEFRLFMNTPSVWEAAITRMHPDTKRNDTPMQHPHSKTMEALCILLFKLAQGTTLPGSDPNKFLTLLSQNCMIDNKELYSLFCSYLTPKDHGLDKTNLGNLQFCFLSSAQFCDKPMDKMRLLFRGASELLAQGGSLDEIYNKSQSGEIFSFKENIDNTLIKLELLTRQRTNGP